MHAAATVCCTKQGGTVFGWPIHRALHARSTLRLPSSLGKTALAVMAATQCTAAETSCAAVGAAMLVVHQGIRHSSLQRLKCILTLTGAVCGSSVWQVPDSTLNPEP